GRDDAGDRHPLDERDTEIPAGEAAQVVGVLDGERSVEPELMPEERDVLAGGAVRDQEECRIAREVHDDEDDRRHAEDRDERLAGADYEEAGHARPLATATSSPSRRRPRSPSASRRARAERRRSQSPGRDRYPARPARGWRRPPGSA